MLTQIRHIQKGVLIVVTIVIVIAFAFLYSDFDFVQGAVGRQDCVVKVYDRCYRQKEVQKLASSYDVAMRLGMYDFAVVLFGENRKDEDRTNFVMRTIILRKEAEKLGIVPTADEIKEAIPSLPVFQQAWVNAEFVENNILGPNGFTDGDLAQLVKDYLSFQKLQELIGAGIAAVPSETDLRYTKSSQRYTASLVKFDRSEYSKDLKITEKAIKAYFDENTETLLSDPKRGFHFVKFTPKAVNEEATNEEKAKAELAFANAVNRAYSDLADEDADFVAVAGQYEGKKADFTMKSGKLAAFPAASPPEELAGEDAALQILFSEVLQLGEVTVPVATGDGGYYVFYYDTLDEPRPLTLKEAKPAIKTALESIESNQAVSDAASAARAKLVEALEAGKPFPAAAREAGLKPEALPNFSESEPPADFAEAGLVVSSVQGLGEKEVSPVIERAGGDGFMLVYVDKIQLYKDEEEENEKRTITASTETGVKRLLFSAWFNQRAAESDSVR
ncbi:MAG: peptidyl-prolyl cis-trans isomerase [Verrucomicrobiales bacterium]|nr:peptidyl-prolyl cis-trans isomerase [Verrucomicrobiales bacterium]